MPEGWQKGPVLYRPALLVGKSTNAGGYLVRFRKITGRLLRVTQITIDRDFKDAAA